MRSNSLENAWRLHETRSNGGESMTTKLPTIASLQRKIERLEAQVQSARDLNLRISSSDMRVVLQNADMRLMLKQIAEMAGEVA